MKKQTVKAALRLTTSFGSGVIVGSTIANQVPVFSNPLINVSVRVASFMMGGMVGTATGDYSDKLVDEIDELFQSAKQTDIHVVTP